MEYRPHSASTLPRCLMGDFIEEMVSHRLREAGFKEIAETIVVRVTSSLDRNFNPSKVLVDNFRTSDGLCVPPSLRYRQKCILLCLNTEDSDICLFCLYVDEFNESCPEPNKSVVRIAYVDSTHYFR